MQQIPTDVITEGWEDFWEFIKSSTTQRNQTKNEWEVIEASQMSQCGTERPLLNIDQENETYQENCEDVFIRKLVEDIFSAVEEKADNAEWERLTETGLSRVGSQTTLNTESFSIVSEAAVLVQDSDEASLSRNQTDGSQESLQNIPIVYSGVEPIQQTSFVLTQNLIQPRVNYMIENKQVASKCKYEFFWGVKYLQMPLQIIVGQSERIFRSCWNAWKRVASVHEQVMEYYKKKMQSLKPMELYSLMLGMATGSLILSLYLLQQQKVVWRMRACRAQQDMMEVMTKMEELQGAVLMSRYPILGLTSNFANF
eukprot:TRINITY_DN25622_c0_g4_i1.p1 TRINITY_DN25622_c0_g4~~TRINITY_DN25622_c0_g4_i1.p1  ORF type:complete len:312 (-),score=27.80 TRINITY_DN25622_c0_g4_i1:1304-2239(-)